MEEKNSLLTKVVVIYSGGMDSFTLLNQVMKSYRVYALSFDYGQKHRVNELNCARRVCEKLCIDHKIVDISATNMLFQSSSLVASQKNIPKAQYSEKNMKSTVVPNRNMILLSLAISYAISIDATIVYYGAHASDHAVYPDCRPEFVDAMNHVAQLCDWNKVSVSAPFLHMDKNQILQEGVSMQLDYSDTWTCYNGDEKACGLCGACISRLEAFESCGLSDPIEYAS